MALAALLPLRDQKDWAASGGNVVVMEDRIMRTLVTLALATAFVGNACRADAQAGAIRPGSPVLQIPQRPIPRPGGPVGAGSVPSSVRCTDITGMRAAGGAFSDSELTFTCVPQTGGSSIKVRVPTQFDLSGKEPTEDAARLQVRYVANVNLIATVVGTFAALRAAGRPLVLDLDLEQTKTDKAPVVTAATIG